MVIHKKTDTANSEEEVDSSDAPYPCTDTKDKASISSNSTTNERDEKSADDKQISAKESEEKKDDYKAYLRDIRTTLDSYEMRETKIKWRINYIVKNMPKTLMRIKSLKEMRIVNIAILQNKYKTKINNTREIGWYFLSGLLSIMHASAIIISVALVISTIKWAIIATTLLTPFFYLLNIVNVASYIALGITATQAINIVKCKMATNQEKTAETDHKIQNIDRNIAAQEQRVIEESRRLLEENAKLESSYLTAEELRYYTIIALGTHEEVSEIFEQFRDTDIEEDDLPSSSINIADNGANVSATQVTEKTKVMHRSEPQITPLL